MTLSVAPLACYEFENNGVDSAGTGPTLTVSGYSATAKLGAAALGPYKNGTGAIGNFAPILTGDYSVAFWGRIASGGRVDVKISNGTKILWAFVSLEYDDTYWLINAAESQSVQSALAFALEWKHFAFVFSGGTTTLYINAVSRGTCGSLVVNGGTSISQINSDSNGQVDNAAIFPAALTADEVSYLYNGGTGRAYADWEIGSGSTTTYDRSILFRR